MATTASEIDLLRAQLRKLEGEDKTLDPAARAIAASSSDNIMLLDLEGRIRYINWTVPDLSIDQVLGIEVQEFVPEEFREVLVQCLERVRTSGRPDRYETNYLAPDGEVSYWESRVSPVIDDGKIDGFAVISSNLTERKREEADRERFFNLSLDLLCVMTPRSLIRINPAFQRVFGYRPEELLGQPILDFVHPDDAENTIASLRRLEQGLDVIDFENRCRKKDGEYLWFSWHASAEQDRAQIYAVGRNVTERKLIDKQLRRSQKMDAVGQLAGGIAHDFNNLLLAIQGNTEFVRRESDPAARRAHLKEVERAAGRASELTRQLLTFARREPSKRRPLDVSELIRDLERLLRSLFPEHIEIELLLSEDLPEVFADGSQLEQVLINLCMNARDAMPRGGSFSITTELHEEHSSVRLSVSDSGTGMSEHVLEHLFEPFFTTKEAGQGTGLGLATVYGIIQQHDGSIGVESSPGQGSTFTIDLPLAVTAADSPTDRAVQQPERRRVSLRPIAGNETILVVEDENIVRRVTVGILERAGYQVLQAEDGAEAVDIFCQHQSTISLVLLDLVMPRLGGYEALLEIRKLEPEVAALFTSGYADGHAGRRVRDAGVPIVRKPYQPDSLLREVRRAIDASIG